MLHFKLLFLAITNKCNRLCCYCPIAKWRNSENPEFRDTLTLQGCIDFIDKTEPTHVEITGGEPTLVPWLDGLLDFLESKGITYLVKSNGYRRCRSQITAWHDGLEKPPINFDKMLIIQTGDWAGKEKYCIKHNIPYGIIGFNDNRLYNFAVPEVKTLFLCPDGQVKSCHAAEPSSSIDNIWKRKHCQTCKAVDDFLIFLA
jgi:Organic radical activating enzymes